MRLALIIYRCGSCGHQFKAPAISPEAYGEFLLRSAVKGQLAYLNAIDDVPYAEVDLILEKSSNELREHPMVRADILQKIYGAVACDPDDDENIFQIGLPPPCPVCKSQAIDSWVMTDPIEFVDIDVPAVTHNRWFGLSSAERPRRVEQYLKFVPSMK